MKTQMCPMGLIHDQNRAMRVDDPRDLLYIAHHTVISRRSQKNRFDTFIPPERFLHLLRTDIPADPCRCHSLRGSALLLVGSGQCDDDAPSRLPCLAGTLDGLDG